MASTCKPFKFHKPSMLITTIFVRTCIENHVRRHKGTPRMDPHLDDLEYKVRSPTTVSKGLNNMVM